MPNTNRIQSELFYTLGQPAITVVETPDLPETTHFGCGCDFTLKVLADNTGAPLNNDKSGFLWWFNDTITSAELILQKWVNNSWSNIDILLDNTYGTNYAFEFFTNDAGENFIGYQLEWALVLSEEGEGSYRVICETEDYLSATSTLYSYEYCLKTYTDFRANGTVRVEYYLNGTLGLNDNDKKVKDLGTLNWYNSFRLGGYFGYVTGKYEETRIKYPNGQQLFVTDEQEPEYELSLKPQPFFVHEAFRTDVMQADTVLMTDYNNKNVINYNQKAVRKNSSYEPDYKKLVNKLAPVKTKWLQEFNNLKKLHF